MEPDAYDSANHVINPDVQPAKSANYTDTKDPNVKIGKHGIKITKADFEEANKNGYDWKDLNAYADWLGGWAHKLPTYKKEYPYYRTYPSGQISAADMALLEARDDPKINAILQRNIAPAGQIPQYGTDDSDLLRAYVKSHPAQANNFGTSPSMDATMIDAIKKGTTKPVVPVNNFVVGN